MASSLYEIFQSVKLFNIPDLPRPCDFKNWEHRFECAVRELANLPRRKPGLLQLGTIVMTHGFVFERVEEGWRMQPRSYLQGNAIEKRFATPEERYSFYTKRQTEKQILHNAAWWLNNSR